MQRMYSRAATKMNSCASRCCWLCWKKRSVTGTEPSVPWMEALGIVDRKQNTASFHVVVMPAAPDLFSEGPSQPRDRTVEYMAISTPRKRKDSPTMMMGSTFKICGRRLGPVLLPSMLKRMSCPKTHTPPMIPSTSRRTSMSDTAAKKVPVMMTRSSGWKRDPGLNPMGTSSSPMSPWPRPKATRATAITMRKASTEAPVKTCCPRRVSRVRRVMSQPLAAPREAPTRSVAPRRTTFATKSSAMLALGWWAGAERLTSSPKRVSTKEASRGAHVNTRRGMGCPLNRAPNSFILGITRPSPSATRTVPITSPSIASYPRTKTPYVAMARISKVAGTQAQSMMEKFRSSSVISRAAVSSTRKKASCCRPSRAR
mmetsp:Transcript_2628/g.7360  ORF Transcript_2628/g.7360 Transcript_2628/m.7360 type:complete len:371 (+) Transcript_2628:738-1850(+)